MRKITPYMYKIYNTSLIDIWLLSIGTSGTIGTLTGGFYGIKNIDKNESYIKYTYKTVRCASIGLFSGIIIGWMSPIIIPSMIIAAPMLINRKK
jgi:hypothetical protein